ncbi:MAG: RraA family protein [Hyphomicrobiales bacterium]
MPDEITKRLSECYSGIVHDVMRAMDFTDFTLPPELRPLFPGEKLAGPVFTIDGKVDKNADPHETLLEWTGLLSKAKVDHIWTCTPQTMDVALMGELSAETLQKKGVLGCIIDGGIRDVEFLIDMHFQCWSRFFTPRDVVGYWLPNGFDVDIKIGDVVVCPGDYALGDRDGCVILPRERAEEIIDAAEDSIAKENKVRTAILDGMDPQKAYLKYGKF